MGCIVGDGAKVGSDRVRFCREVLKGKEGRGKTSSLGGEVLLITLGGESGTAYRWRNKASGLEICAKPLLLKKIHCWISIFLGLVSN